MTGSCRGASPSASASPRRSCVTPGRCSRTGERLEGLRLLDARRDRGLLLGLQRARPGGAAARGRSVAARPLLDALLPPDDAADVIQEAPDEERDGAARAARRADPQGGGRAARLRRGRRRRPDEPALRAAAPGDDASTRRSATSAARRASSSRRIYYVYVLDAEQRLLGVVSFRELFVGAARQARCATSCTPTSSPCPRTWTRRR